MTEKTMHEYNFTIKVKSPHGRKITGKLLGRLIDIGMDDANLTLYGGNDGDQESALKATELEIYKPK